MAFSPVLRSLAYKLLIYILERELLSWLFTYVYIRCVYIYIRCAAVTRVHIQMTYWRRNTHSLTLSTVTSLHIRKHHHKICVGELTDH